MTNPDNAIGTNAAYGGRTSVNAFNDGIGAYSRGVLSGWECVPNSGMTVSLGGSGTTRDVAIAEDNAGNKTTINNISGSPVDVTMAAAPASNSRIDLIVAYVDNPPQGTSTIADNYEACGIIAVQGTASSSPTPPTDNIIRTAITADGASGTTAYYTVLASVTIANGTTDIVSGDITAGARAQIGSPNIDFTTYSRAEQAVGTWINGKTIYRKCYTGNITVTANTRVTVVLEADATYIDDIISIGGSTGYSAGTQKGRTTIPHAESNTSGVVTNYSMVYVVAGTGALQFSRFSSQDRGTQPFAIWVEYTKNS